MKDKFVAIALLLILPFLLTACSLQDLPVVGKFFDKNGSGGIDTAPSGPVSFFFWGLFENEEVMGTLISQYQDNNPNVTITYDDRSVVDLPSYKDAVFARAGIEDAPGVIMVHNTWVRRLAGSLTPAPNISAEDFNNNFYTVAAESAVIDNNVYAVPFFYDGLALVYNKDHFAEIDQMSPPTSWEELRTIALELTVRGPGGELQRAGAAIGSANNIDFFSDILGLMFSQAKVSIPDKIDVGAAGDALKYYTLFLTREKVWDKNLPEASTAFAQGKASMIFVPSWNLLDIINANPGLNIGVAPVPQAGDENTANWASFWMLAVPAGSKNPKASWDFINYLVQEETQLLHFSEASKYRKYGPIYSLKSLSDQLVTNEYLAPYTQEAVIVPKSGEIAGRAGNEAEVSAMREAVNRVIDGADPLTTLREAKTKIYQSYSR